MSYLTKRAEEKTKQAKKKSWDEQKGYIVTRAEKRTEENRKRREDYQTQEQKYLQYGFGDAAESTGIGRAQTAATPGRIDKLLSPFGSNAFQGLKAGVSVYQADTKADEEYQNFTRWMDFYDRMASDAQRYGDQELLQQAYAGYTRAYGDTSQAMQSYLGTVPAKMDYSGYDDKQMAREVERANKQNMYAALFGSDQQKILARRRAEGAYGAYNTALYGSDPTAYYMNQLTDEDRSHTDVDWYEEKIQDALATGDYAAANVWMQTMIDAPLTYEMRNRAVNVIHRAYESDPYQEAVGERLVQRADASMKSATDYIEDHPEVLQEIESTYGIPASDWWGTLEERESYIDRLKSSIGEKNGNQVAAYQAYRGGEQTWLTRNAQKAYTARVQNMYDRASKSEAQSAQLSSYENAYRASLIMDDLFTAQPQDIDPNSKEVQELKKLGVNIDTSKPVTRSDLERAMTENYQKLQLMGKTLESQGYDTKTLTHSIQQNRNREQEQASAQYYENWAKDASWFKLAGASQLSVLASVLAKPWESVRTFSNLAGTGSTEDPNSYLPVEAQTSGVDRIRGVIGDRVNEKFGPVGQFFFEVLMSSEDSQLNALAYGHVGTLISMGASAAGSKANEILQRGGSNKQAIIGGLSAGLIEAATELFSVEALIKAKNSGSLKDLLKAIGIQNLTEGSEEITGEILDITADALNMGNISENSQAVQAYMAQGMTLEQAQRKVLQDNVVQVLRSGAAGAVAGGMSAGAFGFGGYVKNNGGLLNGARAAGSEIATSNIGQAVGSAADFLRYGELGFIPSEYRDAQWSMQAAERSGKAGYGTRGEGALQFGQTILNTTGGEQAVLAYAKDNGIKTRGTEISLGQKGQKKQAMAFGQTAVETVNHMADKMAQGTTLDEARKVYTETVEKYGDGIKPAALQALTSATERITTRSSGTVSDTLQSFQKSVEAVEDTDVRTAIRKGLNASVARQTATASDEGEMLKGSRYLREQAGSLNLEASVKGEDGRSRTVSIRDMTQDGKRVVLSDGSTVRPDELAGMGFDSSTADVVGMLSRFGMGEDAGKALQTICQKAQGDVFQWALDYATAWDQGRQGIIKAAEAADRSTLDADTVWEAYEMGKAARERAPQKQRAEIEKAENRGRQASSPKETGNTDSSSSLHSAQNDKEENVGEKMTAKRKGVTGRKGTVTAGEGVQMDKLSRKRKQEVEILRKLSSLCGVDIVLEASTVGTDAEGRRVYLGAHGWYENGAIHLDINAGKNFVGDAVGSLLATTGHELTHFMQQYAPEHYDRYKQAVLQAIAELEGEDTLERLISEEQDKSTKEGGLSKAAAEDEVVADASQKRLGDRAFWEAVAEAAGDGKQTVMQKVANWLRDWFAKIRQAITGFDKYEEAAGIIDKAEQGVREALGKLYTEGVAEAIRTHDRVGEIKNTATEGGVQFALREFDDGIRFVDVQANQGLFDGLTHEQMTKTAWQLINKRFRNKVIGIDNRAYVNLKSANEYTHPVRYLPTDLYEAKMRASTELDNIVDAGRNRRNSNDGEDGHTHPEAVGGFDYLDTIFKVGNEFFSGRVNIEVNKRGYRFKDLTQLKNITQDIVKSYGQNPQSHFLRDVSMDSIFDSSGKSNTQNKNNSSDPHQDRSYDTPSDMELMTEAAESLSEAGGEEYWAALLESAPELAEDRGQLQGLMKDYRAQAKKLAAAEERLAEAKRQLTTTNRKLNTRGIATLAQDIMKALGAGDAKNRGVSKQVTAILTEAYQKALDALDNGAEASEVNEIIYNEGAVKAAELLATEATHSEKYGRSWTTTSLERYYGEEGADALRDTVASMVLQDFAANRYRPGIQATAADRITERVENRMQKQVDAAADRAKTAEQANEKLKRDLDFYKTAGENAAAASTNLYEQLQKTRAELKESTKLSAEERKAKQKRIDSLETQLKTKRQEAQAWKNLAERNESLLRAALKSKNADLEALRVQMDRNASEAQRKQAGLVRELERQAQREQDILAGKLKPLAMQRLLRAAREEAAAKTAAHKDEIFAGYKERKKQATIRNRIKNLHDEMNRDLLKPREGHYVPQALIRPVVDLLELVNTETNRTKSENAQARIDAINAAYDKLKNDERFSQYYDETVKSMLVELSETVAGRSIYDLSTEELEDVYTVLKAMRTTIRNTIKADLIEKGREAWEIGNALRQELRNGKGASPYLLEKYHMAMLSAKRAFNRFGGYLPDSTWNKVYRMLDDAQLKMLNLDMQATRIFDPVMSGKENLKKAAALNSYKEQDLVDVGLKDADGSAVKITHGMMLALYMHLQNEENMRHLMYGGMTLPDFRRYYNNNEEAWGRGTVEIPALGAKVANLDALLEEQGEAWVDEKYKEYEQEIRDSFESVRESIEEQMTDYDRQWIACAKEFFDGFSRRELNKVTNSMYGFSKAKVDNYFPIVTDKNFLKSEFESVSKNISLENVGFMKERVKSGNPILLEDLTRAVIRQKDNVSRYAGLTEALKTFGNVYNTQTKGFTDSVKKAMAKTYGKNGQKYVENLITDMIGGRTTPGSLFDKIKGNYAQAVLAANLSVTIKQAASFPTAAATVGWGPIMKALARGGRRNMPISRADTELINTYSPLLYYRSKGSIDTEIGELPHAKDWTKKAKWLMGWIQGVDKATVGRLWYAAEYYVKDHYDLEKGTAEQIKNGESPFYQKVAEVFRDIVEDTQPNYTVLQRPDILRNPNKLVRAMTMFSTQRFQNGNILIDAIAEYNAMRRADKQNSTAQTQAARKAAKAKLTNAISSQVVSAVVLTTMTLLANLIMHRMNPWRDDDDELTVASYAAEFIDSFIGTMAGSFLAGSELYEAISSVLTGSKYYGNDVGGISTINEFITSVVNFGQQAVKLIGDEESKPEDWKKLAEKQLAKVGEYLAQMTGVPVANINKIIAGGKNHIIDAMNGEFFSFEAGVERTAAVNARRYLKAWTNGDLEKVDAVESEMLDNYRKAGKSEEEAEKALKSKLTSEAKDAWTQGTLNEQDAIDFLTETGFYTEDEAWQKVREWEDGKVKANFYEMLDDGVSFETAAADYLDHGFTEDNLRNAAVTHTKERYLAGEIDEAKAVLLLGEYKGLDADEAWFKIREWEAKEEHKDDDEYSYKKYETVYQAIDSNKDLDGVIRELGQHGVSEKDVRKQAESYLVEKFEKGEVTEYALKNLLSRYCKITKPEDVTEIVNNASCWKDCGYHLGELNEAYLDGKLTAEKTKQMLIRYGGKTAEGAKKRLRWLDLKKANPSLDISEDLANAYYDGTTKTRENGHRSAQAAGMTVTQYVKAKEMLKDIKDTNDNGTGEDEYIAAISKMNLTAAQKDSLYYEKYKGTTKYSQRKW